MQMAKKNVVTTRESLQSPAHSALNINLSEQANTKSAHSA
ncbi:hypothetical protein SAMN05216216_13331, partial [Lacicoccus qingdaonensis]